jgi:pyrrolysyl-tRNA synthetase-like protein
MRVPFTASQVRRLRELSAGASEQHLDFKDHAERDRVFQHIESDHVRHERQRLQEFRENVLRPRLVRLEERLSQRLAACGFVQVVTPIIMSGGLLARMGISAGHPLNSQVFWLNARQCLRPMLAPHLYYVMKDLLRLWEKPVRIFEVGPCFRKDSQGMAHSNEFTMLNLTEFGLPEEDRHDRIRELAALIAETAGIADFRLETERCGIYGDTLDVVVGSDKLEVGSGAMGPHPLDRPWRITDTWVGIGFGLERLLMAGEENAGVRRMGRSLTYLDGICLDI